MESNIRSSILCGNDSVNFLSIGKLPLMCGCHCHTQMVTDIFFRILLVFRYVYIVPVAASLIKTIYPTLLQFQNLYLFYAALSSHSVKRLHSSKGSILSKIVGKSQRTLLFFRLWSAYSYAYHYYTLVTLFDDFMKFRSNALFTWLQLPPRRYSTDRVF